MPAHAYVALALPLLPLIARKAIAVAAHRILLHAVKGPQAFLPARAPLESTPAAPDAG